MFVMPGLVPGIHVFLLPSFAEQDVDGRDKPGHDVDRMANPIRFIDPFRAKISSRCIAGLRHAAMTTLSKSARPHLQLPGINQ
jgi:hypothetical protein